MSRLKLIKTFYKLAAIEDDEFDIKEFENKSEHIMDSLDYFGGSNRYLIKTNNEEIVFTADGNSFLDSGSEATVYKGYFEGREVAIKLYNASGSVDKYRKLLAIKDSLPNNWSRYIPTIYFMTDEDFIIYEIDNSNNLISTGFVLENRISKIKEIIIMELNKSYISAKSYVDKRNVTGDASYYLANLICNYINSAIDDVTKFFSIKYNAEKIIFDCKDLFDYINKQNIILNFNELEKEYNSYVSESNLLSYILASTKIIFDNKIISLNELNKSNNDYDYLPNADRLFSLIHYIKQQVYRAFRLTQELYYAQEDNLKEYHDKATDSGRADFIDFLKYLKKEHNIMADDLHDRNIMLSPKTDNYQLIDIGFFNFGRSK